MTSHFTHLRRHARQTDADIPHCVSAIKPELRLNMEQLADFTRQRVSRYIIQDNKKGRIGSQ